MNNKFFVAVDPVSTPTYSPVLLLSGSYGIAVTSITINGIAIPAANMSGSRWAYAYVLSPGSNEVVVRGSDNVSTLTPITTLDVYLSTTTLKTDYYYNTLDHWGVNLDLERLPGEPQWSYRYRLLDIFVNRPGCDLAGLTRAYSRELGIPLVEDVLTITPANLTNLDLPSFDMVVSSSPDRLYISAKDLITTEILQLRPGYFYVQLTYKPRDWNHITVEVVESGKVVSEDLFYYDAKSRRLYIHDISLDGKHVRLTYPYVAEIDLTLHTLSSLEAAIEAVTLASGQRLFDVAVTSGYGAYPATGLFPYTHLVVTSESDSISFDWSQVRVRELVDNNYRDDLLNSDGTYYNSRLESLSKQVDHGTRVLWGDTILDREPWSSGVEDWYYTTLPALWDTRAGKELSGLSNAQNKGFLWFLSTGGFDTSTNTPYSKAGLSIADMHSGVGFGADLITENRYNRPVDIYRADLALTVTAEVEA